MADIRVGNNIQILPPVKGMVVPGRNGAMRPSLDASSRLVKNQLISPQSKSVVVNSGVNVLDSAGLSLYDTIKIAVSGQVGASGSLLDIMA